MLVRQSRWLTWAGLAGFLIMAGAPVYAGNLEFLSKSPVSYFNDEDMRLLKETVAQVLDDKDALAKKAGATQRPETQARWKGSVLSRPLRVSAANEFA